MAGTAKRTGADAGFRPVADTGKVGSREADSELAFAMRLYHFTNAKHGLLALKDRRIKIARIAELNDPFEFLGWDLGDPMARAKMHQWKADRHREYGLLSFSGGWLNPLLWGHYADKHQGMALGFEVPDDGLYSPVQYRSTRLPAPSGRTVAEADVGDLLMTKFDAWRYEDEYRCFCPLNDSIHEGDLYFEPFSDTLKLAEVIVGDRATITRSEIATALGDMASAVDAYKARPAFRSFDVVKNRDGSLWK